MLLNNGIVKASESKIPIGVHEYDQIIQTQWSGVSEIESAICLVNNPNWHEIENYMYAAHRLGYKGEVPEQWVGNWKRPNYFLDSKGKISVSDGKRIGIHSGCFGGGVWEKKRWNGFQDIAAKLKNSGFTVINYGNKTERIFPEINDDWKSLAHEFEKNPKKMRFCDYAGLLSLSETITDICDCDYFIANDSGLMHIADALGIPTIAIFGPTLVTKNRPVGKHSLTIQASKGWKDDCIPCQYTPNFKYCQSNECLKNISAEFVFEQFINLRKELNEEKS